MGIALSSLLSCLSEVFQSHQGDDCTYLSLVSVEIYPNPLLILRQHNHGRHYGTPGYDNWRVKLS